MEVQIVDPQQIISKTQRTKIRRMVAEKWINPDDFLEHTDTILKSIHYEGGTKQPYNVLRFDHDKIRNALTLMFEYQDLDKKRNDLRQRLKQKIRNFKDHRQPQTEKDEAERMYAHLKNNLPSAQQQLIPSPTQIRSNPETYRPMMTMLPNQHPVYKYLSLFFPSGSISQYSQ